MPELTCGKHGWRADTSYRDVDLLAVRTSISTVNECAAACSSRSCCAVFKWHDEKHLCDTYTSGLWGLHHPELLLRQGSWHGHGRQSGWVTCVSTNPELLATDGCLFELSVSGMMTSAGLLTTLTHFRSAAMIGKSLSIAVVGSSGNPRD